MFSAWREALVQETGSLWGPLSLLVVGALLSTQPVHATESPYTVLLGVAQDAGHPQAGCKKSCCAAAWADPSLGHRVVSLGVLDPVSNQRWLIDASPDFPRQLMALETAQSSEGASVLDGIFLTHGHIGHYTGLLHLGREVMGTQDVPVYVMPRMEQFLRRFGPWEQLVRLGNVKLVGLEAGREVQLNERIRVEAFSVPHRDEYTETVGFIVSGPTQRVLYLPDIDKWERWERPIESLIAEVDRAYVDGTFFDGKELPGRDMAEIPHPFVVESLARFASLPEQERNKVRFIHFNHTNPLLQPDSDPVDQVRAAGMHVAQEAERFEF